MAPSLASLGAPGPAWHNVVRIARRNMRSIAPSSLSQEGVGFALDACAGVVHARLEAGRLVKTDPPSAKRDHATR